MRKAQIALFATLCCLLSCRQPAVQNVINRPEDIETIVNIQIVGTSSFVRKENASAGTPFTLMLPVVRKHSQDPQPHVDHVAFVAWKQNQELKVMEGRVENKQSDDKDPLDPGKWRAVALKREDLSVKNDINHNPLIDIGNPTAPCTKPNPNFNCVPPAREFLNGKYHINTAYFQPNKPPQNLRARMSIERGTMLRPEILCRTYWIFKRGREELKKQLLPGAVIYSFKIKGTDLTLRVRNFDDPIAQPEDLVTLRATPQMPIIIVRVGNVPGMFPKFGNQLKPDFDYNAYYDLLLSNQGAPVDEKDEAIPYPEASTCSDPTITCGPGGS